MCAYVIYSATKLKAYYVKYAIFVQWKINGLQTYITATLPPCYRRSVAAAAPAPAPTLTVSPVRPILYSNVLYIMVTQWLYGHIVQSKKFNLRNPPEKPGSKSSNFSLNHGTYIRWYLRNRCARLFNLFKAFWLNQEQSQMGFFFLSKDLFSIMIAQRVLSLFDLLQAFG